MARQSLVIAALGLFLFGACAYLFLGGQIAMCLGPLGVTAVQCAAASGRTPEIGPGLTLMALSLGMGALLLAPVRRRGWLAAIAGAIIGGAAGAGLYLALRPQTMEGPGSTGAWYVVPLPLDLAGLAAAAIVGAALLGLAAGHLVAAIRRDHAR